MHIELEESSFELLEGDITSASPRNHQARNNTSTTITVSYKNPETKQRIVQAPQATNLWNSPRPNGRQNDRRGFFFMDVPKARPDNERATPETKTPPASKGKPKKKKSTQYKQNGDLLPDLKDRLKIIRENRIGEENEKLAQSQENVPTPIPSGDEISPSEVQPDLREVLIEKRKRVN